MLSGRILADCDFVAVDLETTGCRPGRNSIIEIGAVRFDGRGVKSTFETLVRPTDQIPRAVEELTGISMAMVAGAPPVEVAVAGFRDFAKGAVLVAHNYRFDMSFLDFEVQNHFGGPFHRPVVDTLSLARRLRPDLRRLSLSSLAIEYGLSTTPDHRAGKDAAATAELLMALMPDLDRLGITDVGSLTSFCGLSGQHELAEKLRMTEGIPDEPGVFVFRDSTGDVIFVGHTHSLRTRTRQYFYPGGSTDRLAHDVAAMTAVRTPSHLDALLLEHRLIDRHKPRYNPAAHRTRAGYLVKIDRGTPYPGLRVVETPRQRGCLIGPFTSGWAAKVLVETLREVYDLRRCARRLDSKLAVSPCSFRDSGTCPAPCVRLPDRDEYRIRLTAALGVLEDDTDLRSRLTAGQRDAADSGRYEDAIRFRDGLRALDRALSSLSVVRKAFARDAVMVEEHDGHVVISFIRCGLRAAVLRGPRDRVDAKISKVVERVYFSGEPRIEPVRLPPEKIAEMLTIASLDESDPHLEIEVTECAETVARIRRSLGLDRRTPRRRHEGASTA